MLNSYKNMEAATHLRSFNKQYLYAFKFFTTWVLILAIFHRHVYKNINLLYLSFITLVVGLYLSFINPRRFVFYFENVRYEYTGLQKFIIVDIIFHILVFALIAERYGLYYKSKGFDNGFLWALAILGIYLCFYDPRRVYGIA